MRNLRRMLDTPTLLIYLPAMLAITLAPGADTLFVVATALRGGWRAGVAGACGIVAGGFVHVAFAVFGLSTLIAHSAVAFSVVTYVGAVYLIYLAIKTLRERDGGPLVADPQAGAVDARRAFARGIATNVLNPKVALFVLAFLPQFVSPARGSVAVQFAELFAIWYVTGAIYLATVAVVVARLRAFGSPSPALRRGFRYTVAAIFGALGVRVALSEAH